LTNFSKEFYHWLAVCHNGAQRLGYELLRGLSLNFAGTHQTENQREFSEVGENKQLLIAIVGHSFLWFIYSYFV
jgi:hypothetical protein